MAEKKLGWFTTPGRLGDRTLESQMIGLERLFSECAGKSILDIGCAEGLLSIECVRAGSVSAHGVEIVPGHIEVARELAGELPCTFEVANANFYTPSVQVDFVLLLAVLHKLKDPSTACKLFASAAKEMVVIRLPPYGTVIIDQRSENVPHDIGAAMEEAGFTLDQVVLGPLDEWLGYFKRRTVVAEKAVEEAPDFSESANLEQAEKAMQELKPTRRRNRRNEGKTEN